jgi:ubiquitin-like protein Pup
MQERIRQQKSNSSDTTSPTEEASVSNNETTEKLKADIDDLLDEIDEVLESNAEEFVKNYVQKGGQ